MRILITGGTGLIGRALASDLARDGHEVILLSRGASTPPGLPAGVRVVQWDGRSAAGWGTLADGAGAIFNLAGENLSAGLWTRKRKVAILQSRVNAGAAVLEAVRQAKTKPAVVIQASGVGAYGTSEGLDFNEDAPYGNDFLAAVSRAWEASTSAVEELGVRRVVARTGVVFTRSSGALPRLLMMFRFFLGGPFGSGRQWYSWVHLQDQVRALRFLMENPSAQGIYNICAEPLTSRQFARLAGKVLRRPSFFPVPALLLRLVLGEMSVVVLEGQRVSSQRLRALGFKFLYPTAGAALQEILGKS